MQFHNLKKNTANRAGKRVGRGGKRGKTAGRGTKGQNARAGRKKRPEMRDIIKRLPKLRGRGRNFLKSRLAENLVVKLSAVEKAFEAGEQISRRSLLQKGLIKLRNGRWPRIKVLADKKPEKKFMFENVVVSKKAKIDE